MGTIEIAQVVHQDERTGRLDKAGGSVENKYLNYVAESSLTVSDDLLNPLELWDTEVGCKGRVSIANSHSCVSFLNCHQVVSTVAAHSNLPVRIYMLVLFY